MATPSSCAPFRAPSEPTKVLVLGTLHLGETSDDLKLQVPEMPDAAFEPLLDALAPHATDGVMVELDAPESVAYWTGAGDGETATARYPWLPEAWSAQSELGLGFLEARDRFLTGHTQSPPELALLALAAYDLPSAVLWWARTDGAERRSAPDGVRRLLDRLAASHNEAIRIGVRLALRLGHRRVFAIDGSTHGDLPPGREAETGGLYADIQGHPAFQELLTAYEALMAGLQDELEASVQTGDLRPFFRTFNETTRLRQLLAQWQTLFETHHESGLDRARVAMWEARNLAMAKNARVAMANRPGGRFLVLVGASHKPFLDTYFHTLVDVETVEAGEALLTQPRG